jgi:hypothetical protein
MSCVFLILDEAAYIDEDVIKSVMTPVLNVNNTSILAVSTPGKKPTVLFNRMTKNEYFDTCSVMFICQGCMDKGIRDPCVHNQDFVPDHLGDNNELIKSIFGADDEERRSREIMGIMDIDHGTNCFTERSISRMMTQPRVTLYDPVRYVYIAIDPAAGSKIPEKRSSDFCIFSICGGVNIVIIGIDAFDIVVTADYESRLIEHVRKIRNMPVFANSTLVIDAESGTGVMAGDIEEIIKRNFTNIVCMGDLGRKPGTYTGPVAKQEMVQMARSHLDSNDIRIIDNLVTTEKNPLSVLEKLQHQTMDYERVVIVSDSIAKPNSVSFSGKQNGTKMDDVAQTFLRVIRSRFRFTFAKEYQPFHR